MVVNFASPRVGAIVKQVYVRRALQLLMDQRAFIDAIGRYFPISAIRETLHGVDQDPNRAIWPEEWRVSG